MEVVLKQDIKGLGHKDDIVAVSPGYGRNFLIPQGMADVANEGNKKVAAENVKQAAHKQAKMRKDAEALAEKISSLALVLKAKVGTSGKIFGAITALQLAKLLKENDVEVDRKDIGFVNPVKELGTHEATVVLYKNLVHTFKFQVAADEGE